MSQILEREELNGGDFVIIELIIGKKIRGIFKKYEDKNGGGAGRFLIIEQDYHNYILSMSELLDSGDIDERAFFNRIKKQTYENKKNRCVDERHIFSINGKKTQSF